MSYVAARGGEASIAAAEALFREELGEITLEKVETIRDAAPFLVDRIMGEASLYAPDLAALALAQTGGDLTEAVLLLRAFRSSQPRAAVAAPVRLDKALTLRRISAAFKDAPGGQRLGPTLDYAHRILKTDVLSGAAFHPAEAPVAQTPASPRPPSVSDWLRKVGVMAEDPAPADRASENAGEIPDLTRQPLLIPAARPLSLQALARADTGGVMTLGYASMRGYGAEHPLVNEVRLVEAEVMVPHPRGGAFSAGRARVSAAEIVSKDASGPALKPGFAATLGWNEVKVIAGATLDLAMRSETPHPAATPDFVLHHTEPVEAAGFCLHFKLPHYVTFQSALDVLSAGAGPATATGEPGALKEKG